MSEALGGLSGGSSKNTATSEAGDIRIEQVTASFSYNFGSGRQSERTVTGSGVAKRFSSFHIQTVFLFFSTYTGTSHPYEVILTASELPMSYAMYDYGYTNDKYGYKYHDKMIMTFNVTSITWEASLLWRSYSDDEDGNRGVSATMKYIAQGYQT